MVNTRAALRTGPDRIMRRHAQTGPGGEMAGGTLGNTEPASASSGGEASGPPAILPAPSIASMPISMSMPLPASAAISTAQQQLSAAVAAVGGGVQGFGQGAMGLPHLNGSAPMGAMPPATLPGIMPPPPPLPLAGAAQPRRPMPIQVPPMSPAGLRGTTPYPGLPQLQRSLSGSLQGVQAFGPMSAMLAQLTGLTGPSPVQSALQLRPMGNAMAALTGQLPLGGFQPLGMPDPNEAALASLAGTSGLWGSLTAQQLDTATAGLISRSGNSFPSASGNSFPGATDLLGSGPSLSQEVRHPARSLFAQFAWMRPSCRCALLDLPAVQVGLRLAGFALIPHPGCRHCSAS